MLQDIFGQSNSKRVEQFIDKLIPHVNLERFIWCGGMAFRYGLKANNAEFDYDREFNDLDALTQNIEDIKPSVQNDFLVYHYHDYTKRYGHNDDFFIVLVDPETKIKIDIYSYKPYFPFGPITANYKGCVFKLRSLEDQLATQVLESTGVFTGGNVPPKWLNSLEAMWKYVDVATVNKYFKQKGANNFTKTCEDVYFELKDFLKDHPEQIVEKPSRRKLYECEFCESLNGFKLSPMIDIYKLLGYVE